jgi:hypothetical protein
VLLFLNWGGVAAEESSSDATTDDVAFLESIRAEPRYAALLRKMNLDT